MLQGFVAVCLFAMTLTSVVAATPQPVDDSSQWYTVGQTAAKGVPWAVDPCPSKGCPEGLLPLLLLGRGDGTEIVETRRGQVFGLEATRGVIGELAFPGTPAWLKVAGRRLIGATPQGVLWTAPDAVAGLKRESWSRVQGLRAVPSKVADAAGEWVAFASGDTAFYGRWGPSGNPKFTRSKPKPGSAVQQLVIRPDGVMVAAVRGAVDPKWSLLVASARRAGKARWSSTPILADNLYRRGSWVWTNELLPTTVLAADGLTWVSAPLPDTMMVGERPEWMRLSEPLLFPAASWPDASWPSPPAVSVAYKPKVPNGRPIKRWAPACTGLGCLLYRDSEVSAALADSLSAGFFADGQCAAGTRRCPPNAAITRLPTAYVIDRTRMKLDLLSLPLGCRPQSLHGAGGLMVLTCGDLRQRRVYARDRLAKSWTFEGRLSGPRVVDIQVGADGTFVLEGECSRSVGSTCVVWVRRPARLGEPDVWSRVAVSRTRHYRVGVGGAVLAIVEGGSPTRVELVPVYGRQKRGSRQSLELPADLRHIYTTANGHLRLQAYKWGAKPQVFGVRSGRGQATLVPIAHRGANQGSGHH